MLFSVVDATTKCACP